MDLTRRRGILGSTPFLRGRKGRKRRQSLVTTAGVLVGAGGLLLFIVGLNRSYRLERDDEPGRGDDRRDASSPPDAAG